jgi:hypothetical protein
VVLIENPLAVESEELYRHEESTANLVEPFGRLVAFTPSRPQIRRHFTTGVAMPMRMHVSLAVVLCAFAAGCSYYTPPGRGAE